MVKESLQTPLQVLQAVSVVVLYQGEGDSHEHFLLTPLLPVNVALLPVGVPAARTHQAPA